MHAWPSNPTDLGDRHTSRILECWSWGQVPVPWELLLRIRIASLPGSNNPHFIHNYVICDVAPLWHARVVERGARRLEHDCA
jgi:hypothetical protein